LGQPGHPSQEVLSIAFSQGFSDEFPPEVMEQADSFSAKITSEDLDEDRRDLRSMPLMTIDGEDARDFDDAIYVEKTMDGYRLVVAIADVSHYVTPNTPLDVEALHRATSVYLPDRVLPMLPERLSNGLCSLKPNEDRLCMVADIQLDSRGERKSSEIYSAIMRSAARCTYNEVQDVLEGRDVPHRNAFKERFELAMELSRALTKMRDRRGAIDFDIPETRVVLDEQGQPNRMERRPRKDSHRLVEECMLAANEAVAAFFQELELPCVYRYHAEPDEEKLALFSELAAAHGFTLRPGDIDSKDLNALLEKLEGHPERRALNQLLLRSMMQAVYTSTNVGHYGLAADYYLHFTSPIRRYPDLIVHRLLKAYWASGGRKLTEAKLEAEEEKLEALAVQSSQRERAAMQVEREVFSFYATLYMKPRLGEEFEAVVSSITDFGFFVELEKELVEGLVKGEKLGPDFELDAKTHTLVYSSGRKVRVGQQLRVQLVGASLERRQLDFDVVAFEGEQPSPGRHAAREGNLERPRSRGSREAPSKQKGGGRGGGGRKPAFERQTAKPPEVEAPRPRDRNDGDSGGSPHPGFDRLRALAARGGGGGGAPVSERPDRLGRRPPKGGGRGGGKRRR
jgi:ribonuclease R